MNIKLLVIAVFVVVAKISSVHGTPFIHRGQQIGAVRDKNIPTTPPFNPHAHPPKWN